MKSKDYDQLLAKIHKESMELRSIIEMIEVSKHHIVREKYCKKNGLTYDKFMTLYQRGLGEIMNYPIVVGVMENIIHRNPWRKNQYYRLADRVINSFRELLNLKKKEVKTSEADKLQSMVTGKDNGRKK